MAGEHAGHRQRMRERFRTQGLDGFAPHEVLELMLFYAIPQKNVNPLAHRLLERFGTLHGVLQASVEQLMQVDGIGETAATLLSLFAHSARQLELLSEGNVTCDVLKVPHHGKFEKSSPAFLTEASPKIAFISDDEKEPAERAVVQILEELGAKVHCARDGGDLVVLSDGKQVWTE